MMSNNDLLKIPSFLRRYDITEELLDETVEKLILANECLLADKLRAIKKATPFSNNNKEALETTDTSSLDASTNPVRLTQVLKERTALEIIAAIKEGHNTFNKLKKKEIADDRVLRSSIRYALKHPLGKSKLVKLSPKVYGVLSYD